MSKNTTSLLDAVRRLFPHCVTEAKGKDGQIQPAIDLNLLRQELSQHLIDGPTERYQLNWLGKRQALLSANQPVRKSFFPQPKESVHFETTKNLFIEGFKNADIQIDDRQVPSNTQKVQKRQNWPISRYLKSGGECKYNLGSKFRLNDDNCGNNSVDNLHFSFSRMADKKITTIGN